MTADEGAPPSSPAPVSPQELASRLDAAGQGHVLRFLPELPADARDALLAQVAALDLERLQGLIDEVLGAEPETSDASVEPP